MRIGSGPFVNLDWLYELRNSRAFGAGDFQASVVGSYSHVQVFNPVGSAVTVIVHRVWASLGSAARLHLRFFDTALTTLVNTGRNLNSGAAAAVAELRTEANVANLGTLIRALDIPTTEPFLIGRPWVCMLGAGEGVLVLAGTTNVALGGSFEWVEF